MDLFIKSIKYKDIKELETHTGGAERFKPPEFLLAKVVQVYDGDTCTVICKLNGSISESKVRLLRINSEEIRQPRNKPNRLALKARALEEKQLLSSCILGELVLLNTTGYDAFGRILSEIWTLNRCKKKIQLKRNINSWMLENGTRKFK